MQNELINTLMDEYFELNEKIKELNSELDLIKSEIKLNMKQGEMDRYFDSLGNLVTYSTQKRKSLDREVVKSFIQNEEDYNKCFKETEFEVLKIMTKDHLEQVKNFKKK